MQTFGIKILIVLIGGSLFLGCSKNKINSQGPDWEKVKSETSPVIAIPNEYGTPKHLSINTLGWEDGLYITRDGLTIYCFYTPLDLLAYAYLGGSSNVCAMGPYVRGPFVDILNHPPPSIEKYCNQFFSSVILYSHRNSVNEEFPPWQISNISLPGTINGAPQLIANDSLPGVIDFFVFVHSNPEEDKSDNICIYRNTTLNPVGTFEKFPAPVNTEEYEENNPHLERIAPNELVLFFTSNDRPESIGDQDIFFTVSHDNGYTWENVEGVNFNTSGFEDMPHLWQDTSGVWWMYHMTADHNIVKRRQTTPGDWKNWGEEILVIEKGNAFGVGEPSLTKWGDIAFAVLYDAGTNWGTSKTNRFDDDIWILPRKGSPLDN